jgi:hypothetical protein
VRRPDTIVTVGVDAEPNETLPDRVLEAVSIAAERDSPHGHSDAGHVVTRGMKMSSTIWRRTWSGTA